MTGWVFRRGKDVYTKSREDGFSPYLYNFIVKIIQNLYAAPFSLLVYFLFSLLHPVFFFSLNRKIFLDD